MSSDRQDILLAALHGLCAEYGAIRVCSLDMDGDGPALVLASPPFGIPGDVPMVPYSLLIPWLYDALRKISILAPRGGSDADPGHRRRQTG